jgi:hypothetical protein
MIKSENFDLDRIKPELSFLDVPTSKPVRRTRQAKEEPPPEPAKTISTAAHELASPLSAIRLSAWALLAGGTLSDEDAEVVRRIEQTSSRMVIMLQRLVGLSVPLAAASAGGSIAAAQAPTRAEAKPDAEPDAGPNALVAAGNSTAEGQPGGNLPEDVHVSRAGRSEQRNGEGRGPKPHRREGRARRRRVARARGRAGHPRDGL